MSDKETKEIIRKYDNKGNLIFFSGHGYVCETTYDHNNEIVKKEILGKIQEYKPKVGKLLPPNKLGLFYNNVQQQLKTEALI